MCFSCLAHRMLIKSLRKHGWDSARMVVDISERLSVMVISHTHTARMEWCSHGRQVVNLLERLSVMAITRRIPTVTGITIFPIWFTSMTRYLFVPSLDVDDPRPTSPLCSHRSRSGPLTVRCLLTPISSSSMHHSIFFEIFSFPYTDLDSAWCINDPA